MSLSSERIYKRKSTSLNRQNLLHAIFGKYIKGVYCGVLSANVKLNDRQLIRHEYFNDIQECLMNYCQLTENRNASGSREEIKSCLRNAEKRKSVKRTTSVSFKKSKIVGDQGGSGGGRGGGDGSRAGEPTDGSIDSETILK